MKNLLILIIAGIAFIAWNFFAFTRYKGQETKDKHKVSRYLSAGMSLTEAIEKVFSELNNTMPSRLRASTVSAVAHKIGSLQTVMNVENVIEIYSTFIHRYICRNTSQPHPRVEDKKVLYAAQSMEFNEQNGFFVLKPDSGEEIDRKYPEVAS